MNKQTTSNDIPFGPILEDSGVRFRLWAPEAKQVELVLVGGEPR